MTETDREAFEAWVRSGYFWSISWEPDGTPYVHSEGLSQQAEAAAAFDAWRAATAHAREQVRELVEAVEDQRRAIKLWRDTPPGDLAQKDRARKANEADDRVFDLAAKLKDEL